VIIDDRMVAWLLKQIDDDLAWAREASRREPGGDAMATGVHWRWINPDDDTVIPLRPDTEELVGEHEGAGVSLRSVEHWEAENVPDWSDGLPQFALVHVDDVPVAVGGHIVRHDPARVIRDLYARRNTVIRCSEESWHLQPISSLLADSVLRDAAAAYGERPGYLPEWEPYDLDRLDR
jgi:hypothetical protein